MKERMQRFMYGRYGNDDLGRFLNIVVLVMLVLSMLLLPQLSSVAIALMVIGYFRIFSRNTYKRSQENAVYLRLAGKVKAPFLSQIQRFKQRKTHRYYHCPSCRQTLRVPKGKGKLSITCPKCKTTFEKRS